MTSSAVGLEEVAAAFPALHVDASLSRSLAKLLPPRPYLGLRPFDKSDWPIFRGRERLIQDILTILARHHLVSVIGPSGGGKSSLVRAGVLATLERRHGRMGVRWRTATMRPGVSPIWALADAVLRSLKPELVGSDDELPAKDVAELRVRIATSEGGLAPVLRAKGLRDDENLLLLVDQFEEVFRYRSAREDEERARLIELLLQVATERPPGLHIITTMRAEYLDDCARFAGLAQTLNQTHYLLPPMTREELRKAIVEPAALKGGSVDPALAERLIDNLETQEDQLPILQHTLLWMWIQEEEKQAQAGAGAPIHLDLAEYEGLQAGTNGRTALSRHGDAILRAMSPEERRVAEIMFRRMVEVEERKDRLRRPTRCGTVRRLAEVSLDVLQGVVDAFRAEDASFILVNRQTLTDDTSIDITHESLIRQWGTLDHWVRVEKAAYEAYDDLDRAARRHGEGEGGLLSGLELSRALLWASREQRTRLWARRYGGDFDAAIGFLTASEEAKEERRHAKRVAEEAARREEEERQQREHALEQRALRERLEKQRLRTRIAVGLAAFGIVLTVALGGASWYIYGLKKDAEQAAEGWRKEARRADAAVIETKASALWSRLQLYEDPLSQDDLTTLWELSQQEEKVRVAFVRQLADDRPLLKKFGFKPQPVVRAVGLRWPDRARQIARRRMTEASHEVDAKDPVWLPTYTGALAAMTKELQPLIVDAGRQKIQRAINDLAGQEQLSDQQLWALPEAVGAADRLEPPIAIGPAHDSLRRIIGSAEPPLAVNTGFRGHSISRAIEVMAPKLSPAERLHSVRYLVALLGQNTDMWLAKTTPRALVTLLPTLDPADPTDVLNRVPEVVAGEAKAGTERDGSYLLALMQVTETLARDGGEALVGALGQALTAHLVRPIEPGQRGALARAAVPLLERQGDGTSPLANEVAEITLKPQQGALQTEDVTPQTEADAAETEEGSSRPEWVALQQALSDDPRAALDLLHAEWSSAAPTPDAPSDLYRRAAQARLLAMLAEAAPPDLATRAADDLLSLLPATPDYLGREAIARALAALGPKLAGDQRDAARKAAKAALAQTGSPEEATAWARAIAALLPADDRDAATIEIVEALKYPTATGAPSDVLLAALATPWPEQYEEIKGRTLPDATVREWLEQHVPDGYSLTAPPIRPVAAGPGQG